ncbi:MAG TPA: hypothetical protein VL981_06230 [Candidatus Methylacidiphilales bacterium]|nr:hypothetical protein [Candidatus Methylacidiphilales bacterium]
MHAQAAFPHIEKNAPEPRAHRLGGDDVATVRLGKISLRRAALSDKPFFDEEIFNCLSREQHADYRQARVEGFKPVLVFYVASSVCVLELRKQSTQRAKPI